MSAPHEERADARLSFEPLEVDGTPRVFAGMHRPPLSYDACLTDSYLIALYGTWRKAWDACAFDRPLYEVRG